MIATERAMSAEERAQLSEILAAAGSGARRRRLAAANAVVMWALLMLGFVLVWVLLASLVRRFAGFDFGPQSPAAMWLGVGGSLGCAVFAVRSSRKWLASGSDERAPLARDLERGIVVDETHTLTAAKRFQEPEHGGLIYFLRTDDDRVLALFDGESQDLGVDDKDPSSSSLQPRVKLTIARAPATRLALATVFDGPVLAVGAPLALHASPEEWPEWGDVCSVPWDDLERRFGGQRKGKGGQAE